MLRYFEALAKHASTLRDGALLSPLAAATAYWREKMDADAEIGDWPMS